MHDKMTNEELIKEAHKQAHPPNQPSSENAELIDALIARINTLEDFHQYTLACQDIPIPLENEQEDPQPGSLGKILKVTLTDDQTPKDHQIFEAKVREFVRAKYNKP